MSDLGARVGVDPSLYLALAAVWPLGSYIAFLCLIFFICKMATAYGRSEWNALNLCLMFGSVTPIYRSVYFIWYFKCPEVALESVKNDSSICLGLSPLLVPFLMEIDPKGWDALPLGGTLLTALLLKAPNLVSVRIWELFISQQNGKFRWRGGGREFTKGPDKQALVPAQPLP